MPLKTCRTASERAKPFVSELAGCSGRNSQLAGHGGLKPTSTTYRSRTTCQYVASRSSEICRKTSDGKLNDVRFENEIVKAEKLVVGELLQRRITPLPACGPHGRWSNSIGRSARNQHLPTGHHAQRRRRLGRHRKQKASPVPRHAPFGPHRSHGEEPFSS
jgi:hypothetical protein